MDINQTGPLADINNNYVIFFNNESMQNQAYNLSQTLLGYDFKIICSPEKPVIYDKLRFLTKQRKLYSK